MKQINVTLEPIAEFHEPKPYEYYPAIRIIIINPAEPNTELVHRCEDIAGGAAQDTPEKAVAIASIYLAANYKAIAQAIISKIGE